MKAALFLRASREREREREKESDRHRATKHTHTLRSTDKERRMTKVTAKGSAKIADVKSGFEPKLSGSVTLVNALDNGVKVRGVISDKAVKTSSLSGCSLGLEKPGSLSAVYSFDSKTTKVTVFGKSTVQDKAVKGKISYNQKGDAWTGEATVDLSDSTSLTAT